MDLLAGKSSFIKNLYGLPMLLLWSALIGLSLFLNISFLHKEALRDAAVDARTHMDLNLQYRALIARMGGVYASVERVAANPYLKVPDRDITTNDGKKLTLLNPAYMTRMIFEKVRESSAFPVVNKITSLKVLNPANLPDEWEREALHLFEKGRQERSGVTNINGLPYLRLMRPFFTERSCLKCHGHQGYKIGDIRGGISIAIPLTLYHKTEEQVGKTTAVTHLLIWLIGSAGIVLFSRLRKTAEEELIRHRDQLEELVKARTKDLTAANKELEAFSYSVSHDLKAPLRAVDGFSSLLLLDHMSKLDAEGIRLLNIIRSNVQKMGQLIEGLLYLSHIGRQEMDLSVIDMKKLAQDVLKELKPDLSGRKVHFEVGPLPKAFGNRALVRQVLANLLSNAVKFTVHRDEARVQVGGNTEGTETVYYVRDNGAGFDMNYKDKLFGVFQRLHSNDEFEGIGVGLSIVHRIIQRHKGRAWAEGKVNDGATFYFTLPVKDS